MKIAVIYRSNTEQERSIIEFEYDYYHLTGRKLTLYDLNTRDGAAMAELYDIVKQPAVLALANDGQVLQMWQDELLPLMNEVMYFDQPD